MDTPASSATSCSRTPISPPNHVSATTAQYTLTRKFQQRPGSSRASRFRSPRTHSKRSNRMNKPWARRAIGAGIALAVGIAMSGCAASGGSSGSAVSGDGEYSGPDVEVTFWHGWTGGAAPTIVPKLIEQFNSEHDNITIKAVPQEWGDIAAKMPLAIK